MLTKLKMVVQCAAESRVATNAKGAHEMTSKHELLESIAKHPAVTRHMVTSEINIQSGDFHARGCGCALESLEKFRRARRDAKRQRRNYAEEIRQPNPNPEAIASPHPSWPGRRLLLEALERGGLPDDLRAMVEKALARAIA